MKLTLDNGIEINIEELEGNLVIKAEKDGEVIEEMNIPIAEAEESGEESNELPVEEPTEEVEPSEEPLEEEEPTEDVEESIKTFEDFFKKK